MWLNWVSVVAATRIAISRIMWSSVLPILIYRLETLHLGEWLSLWVRFSSVPKTVGPFCDVFCFAVVTRYSLPDLCAAKNSACRTHCERLVGGASLLSYPVW